MPTNVRKRAHNVSSILFAILGTLLMVVTARVLVPAAVSTATSDLSPSTPSSSLPFYNELPASL
ncbi:MAG: hypothetical protein WA766_16175, partial [Candidatus Acidiferrales bacterium]